jgi:hypothetical protein
LSEFTQVSFPEFAPFFSLAENQPEKAQNASSAN